MLPTPRRVDDVLVVGGGDAGLLTGLSIDKLNPGIDVTIVDDFSSDPPEVGKSTYQEIVPILHEFLEIPEQRFLSEVKPVWKASVYFKDWTGNPPFHYPFDNVWKYPDADVPHYLEKSAQYHDELYADPDYRTVGEWMVERGMSPMNFDPATGAYTLYDHRAYHLDLRRFNSFLRTLFEERKIALVDDEITRIDVDGSRVDAVEGQRGPYEADLYVDASGFARVIVDEFDDAFRNFKLPLDSAFNAKVDGSLSEAVPATVIESGDFGWFWQIDTCEFRDLGYVFASAFVDEDAAAEEFLEHCGGAVSADDLTKYEFTSGYFEETWQENRVAIGNAASFVEPLQSTGLTASAEAARKLAHLLDAHGRADYRGARNAYNAWTKRMWESIYDFICVHYKYASGDSEFWDSVGSIPVSERVERIEQSYEDCGYDTDVDPVQNPRVGDDAVTVGTLFPPEGFYTLMRNMGVESAFYESVDVNVGEEANADVTGFFESNERAVEGFLTLEEFYRGVLPYADFS